MLSNYCGHCWKLMEDKWKYKQRVRNVLESQASNELFIPSIMRSETDKRGHWNMKIDFILSCVGFAVGLGNIWRFPFKVLSNGGGTFIFAYLFMLCLLAMPLFLIEIIISQFSSSGVTECWNFAIGFKGVGYSMLLMSILCCLYYNLIVGWSIYYLANSCKRELPWISCDNWWNDKRCVRSDFKGILKMNESMEMSSEQFWLRNVITRIETVNNDITKVLTISDNPETIVWYTSLCMLAAWIICATILMYGIKVSGKSMWAFATFPYIVLTIMIIIGSQLEGSGMGIKYYVTVDFKRLLELKIWLEAAGQIFYSLGIGFGGMITFGSYNKFNENIQRNVILVAGINSATSIYAGFAIFELLGNMANRHQENFMAMSKYSGDGLIFIAYPEVLSKLPAANFLCVLFFTMVFSLGIDSQIGMMETFITGILDEFPTIRPKRSIFVWIIHIMCFLLALIMVTKTGFYWFTIFNNYAVAINLLVVGFFESVAISYVYGIKNISRDYKMMIGSELSLYWKICMIFPVPVFTMSLTIFSLISSSRTTLGHGYNYVLFPIWADIFGWTIFVLTLLPIPGYFIYHLIKMKIKQKLQIKDALHSAIQPSMKWGPADKENWLLDAFYTEKYELYRQKVKIGNENELDKFDTTINSSENLQNDNEV